MNLQNRINTPEMRKTPCPALRRLAARHGWRVLPLLFFERMCAGVFPLRCYETDSMATIFGCSQLYSEGFTVPPVYSYAYDIQPLICYVVACLRHVLPMT